MGRTDNTNHDPEDKRSSGRARKRGHSGYGMESIRPHLRAQLARQDLLRPSWPPEEADKPGGPAR
jgi:hypothetical protein